MDLDAFVAKETDLTRYYALTGEQSQPKRKRRKTVARLDLPRHEPMEKFIKGPIPLEWMRKASLCGYSGGAVGLLLWYAAGWQKSNPVKLTPAILAELGVHPKTAKRVLLRLQSIGLVAADCRRGAAPVVTILPSEHSVKVSDSQP
jgi:hypothetical protein